MAQKLSVPLRGHAEHSAGVTNGEALADQRRRRLYRRILAACWAAAA